MNPLEYNNYKKFVSSWVESRPKKGRGLYAEMARRLDTNSVTISQIFRGTRELTPEQALILASFFELGSIETQFFVLQVQLARAGTSALQAFYREQINELREKARNLKNRVKTQGRLDKAAKTRFYSEWYYSGLRLHCARGDVHSISDLVKETGLSPQLVAEAIDFLTQQNLVTTTEAGLDVGLQSTHLGNHDPSINHHRRNWRLKAIHQTLSERPNDLFYSGPMVLSEKLVSRIRRQLVEMIAEVTKEVADSDCEKTACLNIDWFEF